MTKSRGGVKLTIQNFLELSESFYLKVCVAHFFIIGEVPLETKKCIECNEEISVNAEICPKCGVRQIQNETKFCKDCGAQIAKKAEICPKCGVRQINTISSTLDNLDADKNKTVAGVLALLLGGIGIHKFYLGQIGKGIIYILFCWTYIPALLALIEGIQILSMTDDKFNEKYFSNK